MEVRTMIKKALVALLSSAILATTVVSGVVATPTVAYAEETKVIKITEDDCIAKDETGYVLEAVFGEYGGIIKACDADVYFLEFGRVGDELLLYQLPSIASGSSVVIDTDRYKYTIDSSYTITDVLSAEQEEKDNERAMYNKWISDMVICKHPSAGNVTLSASEKKGTLTVTKADIKAATKLDMMLKSKKAVTVKIKASSKSKAVNQFKSLRKLTGHANTYGVVPWNDSLNGIPYTEKVNSYRFKKSGSFYTVNISKSISQNYTYICTAYENAFKRAKRRNTGYDFVKGTHLCDCSDLTKVRVIEELILNNHRHSWVACACDWQSLDERVNDIPIKSKLPSCSKFKILTSNNMYGVYVCEDFAEISREIGWASGLKSIKVSVENYNGNNVGHAWALFTVKDSSGKTVKAVINNGAFEFNGKSNDGDAMTRVLGVVHNSANATFYVY